MDIHMNATLRNDYATFKRKDKKPIEGNMMNMGGIGSGFGVPPRMNQQSQQGFIGGNQNFGMLPMGMGLNPPPNMSNINKMMPPPTNPNFNRPY